VRTDLFDFELPAESIALRPAQPRDSARMLVVQPGGVLRDQRIADLPKWLEPGDQLVVNDTKVISAQLKGRRIGRETEPKIEATLIKRLDSARWQALVKPAKKLAPGDVVRFGNEGKVCLLGHLDAEIEAKGRDGEVTLSFSFHGPALDQAISDLGSPPLPPYIASKRTPDERDIADYQTMFAVNEGAVAAPTAGLHFTPALEAALRGHGVGLHRLTLHVGAGTFLPVKMDDTAGHKMHAEWGCISAETAAALNDARATGGRIVAVGTTSLRLLESAAAEDRTIQPFSGETSIFITPGYRFRAVDILLTNFHLPRSTLFMLVSAFSGLDSMKQAYAHAIASGYRFYSYGDACLLFHDASIA
jgi:S-adenosylmethionine:tRNA ribosyltransferase-isomerase